MQTLRTEAIILRRTNYGEADRILNMLTPQHGKVSAIAKGLRKAKSKLVGGLELFAVSDITILKGKSDVGTISSARMDVFYGSILKEYERMQLGYEIIRLINRATETVAEEEFYYLLKNSLVYLNELTIDYRVVEVWFRLRFAAALGTGLNMAHSLDGQPLKPDVAYDFDFTDMAFIARSAGRFGADHIKVLRLINAKNPAVLRQVSGLGEVLDDCLWLVRAATQ